MAFLATFTSEFFMTTAWRWVINTLFGFVADYGWRVILFTVCLKLLLFPLDFFNRKRSKDNQRIMRRIKPEMERLEKQFANDPKELMMRKRALQKKNHFGGMGMTCLTTILTLFIFMTLWSGFTSISQEMNLKAYETLETTYTQSYISYLDPSDRTKSLDDLNDEFWTYYVEDFAGDKERGVPVIDAYKSAYKEEHGEDPSVELLNEKIEEFAKADYRLYLIGDYNPSLTDEDYYANIRIETTENGSVAKPADGNVQNIAFKQATLIAVYGAQHAVAEKYDLDVKQSFLWVKNIWRADTWQSPIMTFNDYKTITKTSPDEGHYNDVIKGINKKYGSQWNGYLILVVLTVGLNFLSQWLMMRMQKKSGEAEMQGTAGTMKVMMWVMPIMLAIFALNYAAAFALYMVTNTGMTLFSMGVSTLILNSRDKRLDAKEAAGYVRSQTAVRSVRTVKAKPTPSNKKSKKR